MRVVVRYTQPCGVGDYDEYPDDASFCIRVGESQMLLEVHMSGNIVAAYKTWDSVVEVDE